MANPGRPDLSYGLLAGHREAFQTIAAALLAHRGNVVHAARSLGVSHRAFCRWLEKYPELAAARDMGRAAAAKSPKT